jgi:hypothetical protein
MRGLHRTTISLVAVLVGGCSVGFAGGGLSKDIRTVSVDECLNSTADPGIAQFVRAGVKQAVESRLGLRAASEATADAIVHCTVVRYEPDMQVLGVQSIPGAAGTPNQVNVTRRQVEMTVDIVFVNQKTGKSLWDGRGQPYRGQYSPGREIEGKQAALDLLIRALIDGVQANW